MKNNLPINIKKINEKYLLVYLFLALHIFFTINLFLLNKPPFSNITYSILILLSLIPLSIFLLIDNLNNKKIILVIIVYFITLAINIFVAVPNKQDYLESTQKIQKKNMLIEEIFESPNNDKTIDPEKYSSIPNSEVDKIITETIKQQDDKKEVSEIKENIVKSVKVEQNKWNCESFGCAYGDGDIIWTIDNKTRFMNITLSLVNMTMMIVVIKKKYL